MMYGYIFKIKTAFVALCRWNPAQYNLSFLWYYANEGNDGFAVGRITAVSATSITVADPFEENTRVSITDTTRIEAHGQAMDFSALNNSMFVQVSGTPTNASDIVAGVVLVIEPPQKQR